MANNTIIDFCNYWIFAKSCLRSRAKAVIEKGWCNIGYFTWLAGQKDFKVCIKHVTDDRNDRYSSMLKPVQLLGQFCFYCAGTNQIAGKVVQNSSKCY